MARTDWIEVRRFRESDVGQLLVLMRDLATFEGYIDDFVLSESDLIDHGLGSAPAFNAWVAHANHSAILSGMAVTYELPWTYDRRPTVVLKELFVAEDQRDRGIGRALMRAVTTAAQEVGASRLLWTVLHDNSDAKAFYQSFGGRKDPIWERWTLDPNECSLGGDPR